MVNDSEVHDHIKRTVIERQRAHVTDLHVDTISEWIETPLCASDHPRVHIDTHDFRTGEPSADQLDADALAAANFEDASYPGQVGRVEHGGSDRPLQRP